MYRMIDEGRSSSPARRLRNRVILKIAELAYVIVPNSSDGSKIAENDSFIRC